MIVIHRVKILPGVVAADDPARARRLRPLYRCGVFQ